MAKTYFYWDPIEDNVVREYDEAGVVTAEYTTEPDLYGDVISQRRQAEYRQFHYDAQGSTLAATDESEDLTDRFAYTAFGEIFERTGTTLIPFQYVGQKGYLLDAATSEHCVRRRTFAPLSARWLSLDPITSVAYPNRFQYARNSPTSIADASGQAFPGQVVPNVEILQKNINWRRVFGYDKGDEDAWGHWWIRLDNEYSFGWWPRNRVGGQAEAVQGVPGEMNGTTTFGGIFDTRRHIYRDPHHADEANTYKARLIFDPVIQSYKLKYGFKAGAKCCALDMTVKTDVRAVKDCIVHAATEFASTETVWKYPGKYNCHSFQAWLLPKCCIWVPGPLVKAAAKFGSILESLFTEDEKGMPEQPEEGGPCACSTDANSNMLETGV